MTNICFCSETEHKDIRSAKSFDSAYLVPKVFTGLLKCQIGEENDHLIAFDKNSDKKYYVAFIIKPIT